jgi:hypothetical protein
LLRIAPTTLGGEGDVVPTVSLYRITGKYFKIDAQGARQCIAILEEVQRPAQKVPTARRSDLHKTLRR